MTRSVSSPGPREVYLEGAGLDGLTLYVEKALGPARAAEVSRRAEASTGPLGPYRRASAGVPLAVAPRYLEESAHALGGTFQGRLEPLKEMGAFVAAHNLNGVFKVVLSYVANPDRLARRLSSLWTTYFPNVQVDVDLDRIDQREVRCVVRGLEPLSHINAAAAGWLAYAFRLVGAESVDVEEVGLARGTFDPGKPLEYTLRWS